MKEEKEKQGLIKDRNGALFYRTKNYDYDLLCGYDSKNYNSDILFIFREPTENGLLNGETGEMIGYMYGGFDGIEKNEFGKLDYIKLKIENYEKEKGVL